MEVSRVPFPLPVAEWRRLEVAKDLGRTPAFAAVVVLTLWARNGSAVVEAKFELYQDAVCGPPGNTASSPVVQMRTSTTWDGGDNVDIISDLAEEPGPLRRIQGRPGLLSETRQQLRRRFVRSEKRSRGPCRQMDALQSQL